jgi:GTPase Era involved in 16S rRNA processing
VIFRHPVALAADQRTKLRVRRGLGTREEAEAQGLVDQLNAILVDPELHVLSAKPKALASFDRRVVAAFYDNMEAKAHDSWADRERLLPLPSAVEGYSRVLMVGTTGSGKTTLVRQFLGTDPDRERFPSTSAAKTTTADIEVILADGQFEAAVSFVSRETTRQYLVDCVIAAVAGHIEGASPAEVARRFIEHNEMRFRLNYLLGSLNAGVPDDALSDEDEESTADEVAEVSTEEQQENARKLRLFLDKIAALAATYREQVVDAAKHLEIDIDKAKAADRDALQELVEEQLVRGEDFDSLIDELMEEIEARFGLVVAGEFERGRDEWPVVWQFRSTDRGDFIRQVNRFSSNYSPNFGRLLTPLVEGIRVRGPFKPGWGGDGERKLVLLDGQGIGHTADTSTSISTAITRRFHIVDTIVLVDNAAQPMQAGSAAVLSTLVSSGHESKLAICFTHFDDLKKADNLRGTSAKRDHVIGSYYGVVKAIGQRNGREAEHALSKLIPDRIVFVADIDKPISEEKRFTRSELGRLLTLIRQSIVVPVPPELHPFYDVANLVLAIQKATQLFHERWNKALSQEHWARIKALARRLGERNQEEYAELKPIADLIQMISQEVSLFLSEPYKWSPAVIDDERKDDRLAAIDIIRRALYDGLHDFARDRILDGKLPEWLAAYSHRGYGSTSRRASDIRAIYASAAPIPNETPGPDSNAFLFAIRELVANAIKTHGGEVRGWEP